MDRPRSTGFVLGGAAVAIGALAYVLFLTPFDFGFGAPQVRIDDPLSAAAGTLDANGS